MSGQTYYVDPAMGDDANDGLTPLRPFKTYATRELTGGDALLFKRGCVIRDVLHTRNGAPGAPITYGAYGLGEKPAFLGSVPVGNPAHWVEDKPSLWQYTETLPSEVCNVIFNDDEACGILRWRLEDLRQPGDWHYTAIGANAAGQNAGDAGRRDAMLYLCSPANPGRVYRDIECALWGQRKLVGGQRHVVLKDLSFRNAGVHGYQEYHAHDVVIRNCEFRFIGGAVWHRQRRIRFGNAIELWDGASDVTVEGCRFENIYDSAVTHQGGETRNIPERVHFRNNLFINCGLAAYECREPSREIYFEHNTCINGGGGFSMQGETPPRRTDPYPQPVGYHVWAWLIEPHTQPGNVYIRHNIFCDSYGAAICLTVDPADAPKFILDHNCYWQTTGELLAHIGGHSCVAQADISSHMDTQPYPVTEFGRYQAESGQDAHSRVAEPLFMDAARGDYRQGDASPCVGMGIRTDIGCSGSRSGDPAAAED